MENVFILSAVRTPIGSYGGYLSDVPAVELGGTAIKAAIGKAGVLAWDIDAVIFGNVLSGDLGQGPARQAAINAGLPYAVSTTTVNKVCASGLKAIGIVFNEILMGDYGVGIAGGMENMSRVPFYISGARFGMGYGNQEMVDGLAKDGLTDAFSQAVMGVIADKTAEKYSIDRKEQDHYAELSYKRSMEAWISGAFSNEVISLPVKGRKGEIIMVTEDEEYKKANFEKMKILRPAFSPGGTATAANSSPMSDGASAVVLCSSDFVTLKKLDPLARIIAYGEAEQHPDEFITSPVLAAKKVLGKAGLKPGDIDFYEVNEAFALVPILFIKSLGISPEKVNISGGAVSLGHPLGASGARILTTLIHNLKRRNGRYGLATVCNGGGGASAMIIENLKE